MKTSAFSGSCIGDMEKPLCSHFLSYSKVQHCLSEVILSVPTVRLRYNTVNLFIKLIPAMFSILVFVDGVEFLHG